MSAADRPSPPVPAAEDDAVEKDVRHVLSSYGIEEGVFEGEGAAVGYANLVSDLIDAAGVPALRAEVERLRDVAMEEAERADATHEALDEARQQLADLRAVAESCARSCVACRSRLAALAGDTTEAGAVATRVEVRGRSYGKTQAMVERVAEAVRERGLPAEVLPVPSPDAREDRDQDRADVSHWVETVISEGYVTPEGIDALLDRIKPVVRSEPGQVSAEQAWREGHEAGCYDRSEVDAWRKGDRAAPTPTPNPYAVTDTTEGGA